MGRDEIEGVSRETEALLNRLSEQDYREKEELHAEMTANPDLLPDSVKRAFEFHIRRLREMYIDIFVPYEEAAKAGVPYAERIQLVDSAKLAWVTEEGRKMVELQKKYRIKPFLEWYRDGDYSLIRGLGWYRYAELFLSEIVEEN